MIVGTFMRKSILAFACLLCSGSRLWAQNESLPEMVRRHEQEIKSLREALESLKTQSARSEPEQKAAIAGCVRDLKVVGRYTYTKGQLDDVATMKDTGISFKLIRIEDSPPTVPFVVLASNIDALNNRELLRGSVYKFSHRKCNYTLSVEDVSPSRFSNMLMVFLNYE